MLILKRKVGEVIRIANDIEVHVLAIEGEIIKLGFNAPKDIQILRAEVFEAIKAENMSSLTSNTSEATALLKQLGIGKKPNK